MQGLEIDYSFWCGLYRYDIHIMSDQPPPTEDGWEGFFLVYKQLLGIRVSKILDSIRSPYNPIILKVKKKYNI